MQRSLELLEQIIGMAKEQDLELKKLYIQCRKATKAVGESAVLHYLIVLKELIADEAAGKIPPPPPTPVTLGDKTYSIALGEDEVLPNINYVNNRFG